MSTSSDKAPSKHEQEQVLDWLDDLGIGFEKKKPVQSEKKIPSLPAKNSSDAA